MFFLFCRITTPVLNYRGDACLSLGYHMFGPNVGHLEIYRVDSQGWEKTLRTVYDSQGEKWLKMKVNVTLDYNNKVSF